MENETLKLIDIDGNILEYRILSTFIYNNISNMYDNILHDIKAPGYLSRHANR